MIVGELPVDSTFARPLVRPSVKLGRERAPIAQSEQLESELASLGGGGIGSTVDEGEPDDAHQGDDAHPALARDNSAPYLAVPRGHDHDPDSGLQLLAPKTGGSILSSGKTGMPAKYNHHHHGGSATMLDQIPEDGLESRRNGGGGGEHYTSGRRSSSVAHDGHGNGHAKPSLMAAIRRGSLAWLPGRRHHNHNDLESNMGSKVSLSQLPPSSGPLSEQALESRRKNRRFGDDALSTALSALYAKIVVILGIALPVTEILSSQIPANVYQGFYLFLYTVSIVFVIFVYASTMRRRAVLTLIKSYHEKTNSSSGSVKKRIPHFGSFYLRVGAIAFGIGTMVYSGLEFGQYFELNASPGCSSIFIALTPAARMLLSLVQMQFIFLNTSDLDMARHKVFARFGLMHMVATNLCEWLYVLVEETKHEIHHLAHTAHHHKRGWVRHSRRTQYGHARTDHHHLHHDRGRRLVRGAAARRAQPHARAPSDRRRPRVRRVPANQHHGVARAERVAVPVPLHDRVLADLCRHTVRDVEEGENDRRDRPDAPQLDQGADRGRLQERAPLLGRLFPGAPGHVRRHTADRADDHLPDHVLRAVRRAGLRVLRDPGGHDRGNAHVRADRGCGGGRDAQDARPQVPAQEERPSQRVDQPRLYAAGARPNRRVRVRHVQHRRQLLLDAAGRAGGARGPRGGAVQPDTDLHPDALHTERGVAQMPRCAAEPHQTGARDCDVPAGRQHGDVVHQHADQGAGQLPALASGLFRHLGLDGDYARVDAARHLLPLPLDDLPVRGVEVDVQGED
uniref:Otopetrin n=1 Tax=Anopheles coluzzii TaxID=1518534 RepID=A0A6E8V861_ANOCL